MVEALTLLLVFALGTILGWFLERFLYMKDLLVFGREQGCKGRMDVVLPGVRHSVMQGYEVKKSEVDEDSEHEETFFVTPGGTKVHISDRCEGLRNATSKPTNKTSC